MITSRCEGSLFPLTMQTKRVLHGVNDSTLKPCVTASRTSCCSRAHGLARIRFQQSGELVFCTLGAAQPSSFPKIRRLFGSEKNCEDCNPYGVPPARGLNQCELQIHCLEASAPCTWARLELHGQGAYAIVDAIGSVGRKSTLRFSVRSWTDSKESDLFFARILRLVKQKLNAIFSFIGRMNVAAAHHAPRLRGLPTRFVHYTLSIASPPRALP